MKPEPIAQEINEIWRKWEVMRRASIVDRFTGRGLIYRLECPHCAKLPTSIRQISFDTSPTTYECWCMPCREVWQTNDGDGAAR